MDERLINAYGIQYIEKQFSNQQRLLELVNIRLKRNDVNNNPAANELALVDAIDNYIAKMLLENPSKLDRKFILEYRDKLFAIFKNNPEIAYDSILFRKDIALKLFNTNQIKEIIEYKVRTSARVHNSLISTLNTPGLMVNDEVIRYASYQIGNDNPKIINMLDNLYKYLLENRKSNSSLIAKEFILRYTSYMATKDLNIPKCNVYITNDKLSGQKFTPTNLGTSYGNTGIITINRDSLINNITIHKGLPGIGEYMMVVSHETKHSSQSYYASQNNVSKAAFEMQKSEIFSKYLSDKDYDEYHSNYLHSEIEADANDYGWFFAYKQISKYAPKEAKLIEELVSKRIKNDFQELTATKADNATKRHTEAWKYNVIKLNEIVKNNPNVLNEYPILKTIYKSNGEPASFMELIHAENKHKDNDEIGKIYSDYYTYYVANGEFAKIDTTRISEEDEFLFYAKLTDMLIDEYEKINHSIRLYNKHEGDPKLIAFRQKEFLFVNSKRIDRIKQLIDYMNASNGRINELASIDTNRDNNKRAFGFRLGYIERMHQNFIHYLSKINEYGITDQEIISKFETLRGNAYDTGGRGK